jgi:hypothetical protein
VASINIPIEGRKGFAEKHDIYTKYMDFIQFFSYVEAQLRVLVSKLCPGSCNDGKGTYSSIYGKVLSELELTQLKGVFDFSTSIRNALHTSGVFLPTNSHSNKNHSFHGRIYTFEYGTEINFVWPELVVEIEEEIFDCLIKILEHQKVRNLK